MLLDRLFRPRPARAIGQALYQRVVDQSRTPALYADLGAPDSVEGRFEIYTLHAVLLLERPEDVTCPEVCRHVLEPPPAFQAAACVDRQLCEAVHRLRLPS